MITADQQMGDHTGTVFILKATLKDFHEPLRLSRSELVTWRLVRQAVVEGKEPATAELIGQTIQTALDNAIEALQVGSYKECYYQILNGRYRQNRTPHEIYTELHLSRAHYYRLLDKAIAALANILLEWEMRASNDGSWTQALPPPTYDRLFGVEAYIESVLSTLTKQKNNGLIMIDGLGGIGKTAVGDAVTRRAMVHGLFGKLIWQTAQRVELTPLGIRPVNQPMLTPDALLNGIAVALKIPELQALPLVDKQRSIQAHLQHIPTLIVIDNLETAVDVRAIIDTLRQVTQGSGTKVLLTSRYRIDCFKPLVAHHLPPLAANDAIALIKYLAAQQVENPLDGVDDFILHRLQAAAAGHPLAIKLLVSQFSRLPLDIVLRNLHTAGGMNNDFYTFIYRHSWQILSDVARITLLSMPHVNPLGACWAELLMISGLAELELNQAINELVQLSLINVGGTVDKQYSLHPLTHQFILSELLQQWTHK